MKRMVSLAALLLACAAVAAPSPAGAPPNSGVPAPVPAFPALQAFADAAVRDGRVPGIAIAIGVGDGPTRFITVGKAGFAATDRAATPDTLWRIYSMTKPVTGIAAMILVERGKLRLDQPVSDFFPEFRNPRVLVDPAHGLETRPAAGEITIRELMTHSAGLNYAIFADTPARQAMTRDGIVPLQFNPALEAKIRGARPTSLAEFARRAGRAALVADPGTRWSYSMGLDVLAAIVERASHTPFELFVQREIFTPLGMTSSYWQVPSSRSGDLASSYVSRTMGDAVWPGRLPSTTATLALVDEGRGSVYLRPPSFAYGGAGLVSTARDYDRFLHMLQNDGVLDGRRILRPETARLARSDLLPPGVTYSGSGPIPPGETAGFGAGGFVTLAAADGFGRGRGTYGWDGAAGSRAWTDPVRRIRVTMMINVIGAAGAGGALDTAVAEDVGAAPVK